MILIGEFKYFQNNIGEELLLIAKVATLQVIEQNIIYHLKHKLSYIRSKSQNINYRSIRIISRVRNNHVSAFYFRSFEFTIVTHFTRKGNVKAILTYAYLMMIHTLANSMRYYIHLYLPMKGF